MQKHKKLRAKAGFTLIELLIVMGIVGILATIVLVAVNPARQFAQARDTQRVANINAILNAVSALIADNRGIFENGCPAGEIPTVEKEISGTAFSIYECLVPKYLSALPLDPVVGSFTHVMDYDSGYSIVRDATTSRITIYARNTEVPNEDLFVTR